MNSRYTFINDSLIPHDAASLPVTDMCIQRGYGIFDYLRTYQNKPLFLADHLERLFVSANEMRLPVNHTKDDLKEMILELLQKNKIPNSGIRITLTGGCPADGYSIATPNIIITQQPLEPVPQNIFNVGTKLVSFSHQRQLAHVKTTDYLMAVWLRPYIKQKGAEDVLYHQNNIITECPRANIFIVDKDDTILTPSANILKGVIRKKIIEICHNQHNIREVDITLKEVYNAKEVFITSTTKQVLPVTQVNDTVINNGNPGIITQQLHLMLAQSVAKELDS